MIKYLLVVIHFGLFAQEKATIEIKIKGIEEVIGNLRLAFYKKGSNFPKEGSITYGKEYKINQTGDMVIQIVDIPYGEYVIAAFQDKNKNQKIDKNFVGYPTEPFGFSKNFRPRFSEPKFTDCNVIIGPNNNSFVIKLL